MLDIEIKTIPHGEQRYETVGDYWVTPDGKIKLRISDLKNWRYEILIAIHELIELALTRDRGITIKEIDEFDMQYEKNRQPGDESEPGDSVAAPYHREHVFATVVEAAVAQKLRVDWDLYDKILKEL